MQRDIIDFVLSADAILSRVDEYTLYCHYLEFEPELGKKYCSKVRAGDDNPSFALYPSKFSSTEFRWKDHGSTLQGDIFDLISILHGKESKYQTYLRVNRDFSLGLTGESPGPNSKIIYYTKPEFQEFVIKIKSRPFIAQDLEYWNSFGISESTLKTYNVTAVEYMYFNDLLITPKDKYCYAYRIKQAYKIYQPFNTEYKFRNNFGMEVVEGLHQVQGNFNVLIITKALKDVMMFHELGIDAIAGKSENTRISAEIIMSALKVYKKVIVWLDNDDPGIIAAQYYTDNYPVQSVIVPLEYGCKDPSDFRKLYGKDQTLLLINKLIYG